MAAAVIGSSTTGMSIIPPTAGGAGGAGAAGGTARTSRRKQRCWLFQVDGVTNSATESALMASVRERYTTVKRLVMKPVPTSAEGRNLVVEVQFTGPQPSEGPGALLCDLLGGASVDAKPVELPRGRKKRARTDAASSEASDSDGEDGGSKKMGGHRSTNSLGRMGEEDEAESPGGGRCTTAKSGRGGSPMVGGGKPQDTPAFRRTSSRDSGGNIAAPSSTLAPLSSVGIFKSPSSSDATSLPSISSRVVVPADDAVGRAATPASMPVQHRVVSSDAAMPPPQKQQQQQQQQQPLPSMQQQQLHALQQQHRLQQFSRASGGAGGAQWDDVVGRMTTPQNSGHSLEMGSVDLNSNGSQPPVKSELDPLLVSSNSVGTWGSNDSQVALLGPMPPPQSMPSTLRGWSFDSSQVSDGNTGNMVVDLSDVGLFPGSGEGESNATGTKGATASTTRTPAGGVAGSNDCAPGAQASSPDDGAGKQQQQEAGAKWTSDDPLPMEKVVIEPSRNECDFEGRPSPTAEPANSRLPVSASSDRQCHLVFTGLENTGQDLQSLRVTAHFGVDAVHKVGKITSPIQIGSNGRAYSGVFYPSMQEIWPELYSTSNIRAVEVDVVVEIRSDSGEYQYVGPQLKVTYVRAPPPDARDAAPRPAGRRTASRAPIPFSNDGTQVSYSCVDYSCGDWFSDMCQSVFRGSATAHQPMPEDPNDLMSVDP